MSLIFGTLDIAGLEHQSSDPVTFLYKGRIYYNTADNVCKYYNGSVWKTLVDTATTAIDAANIANGSVSNTEFQYLNGVTSAIQTQIDGKEPTITTLTIAKGGTNSGTALNNDRIITSQSGALKEAAAITASRALVSSASGIPVAATTTSTEIGYVNGVTSAIQTQIDAKVTGPGSSTDNAVVRFDSTTGKLVQNSVVIASDAGAVSGITQLDVDNIRVDGNTISSTDSNGNIVLSPNGSGMVKSTQPIELSHESGVGTPSAGTVRVYAKSDDKLYIIDSGGVESEVGAGFTAGQILGTNTNDSASAGNVGEHMYEQLTSGSAVSLSNGTPANVLSSITLTAGDWDVSGIIAYNIGATTVLGSVASSISTTSATLATTAIISGGTRVDMSWGSASDAAPKNTTITHEIPRFRVSVATTQVIYLVARGGFSTSTLTAHGSYWARRVR